MMRVDLTTLRIFIAVYNLKSLTKAAEQEHIAPSAVSKRINDFETELGVQIFYRHPRGVSATPAGEALLVHARSMFEIINEMTADLSAYGDGRRGQVRIHAHSSAVHQYLPQEIAAFNSLHPAIRVVLREESTPSVVQSMLDGVADIGIYGGHMPLPAGLRSLAYRADRLVALLPREDPLAAHEAIHFLELRHRPLISLETGSSLQVLLSEAAESLGFALNNQLEVVTFGSAIAMASAGLGVAVVPDGIAGMWSAHERLRAVPLADAWAHRQLAICVRASQKRNVAVDLMLDHLCAAAPYPTTKLVVPNR